MLQAVGVGGVNVQLQGGRRGGHVVGAEEFGMVEGVALALLAQHGVCAKPGALGGGDGSGVAVLVKAVGEAAVAGGPVGDGGLGICLEQAAGGGVDVFEGEAVLVLGDVVGGLGVEAAVMKEDEGLAAGEGLAVGTEADGALGEVPVGDVVAGVAEHGDAFEHAGDEIHPALVHEDAFVDGDDAVAVEFALPPLEVAVGVVALPDGAKTEVVGASAAYV